MSRMTRERKGSTHEVEIPVGTVMLAGELCIPRNATALVVFVHGSGSSRHSPRNQFVAAELNEAGLATLLFDLLTQQEERFDIYTAQLRFNIDLLTERVVGSTRWLLKHPETARLKIGYFGASTGAAAALVAAAQMPGSVGAVVSRGGRPDLAGEALPRVEAPTLLIVGGDDCQVVQLNQEALALLRAEKKLEIVPGATHLFQEPGTLERVAELARDWFKEHLTV